jgi:hypothetical protein
MNATVCPVRPPCSLTTRALLVFSLLASSLHAQLRPTPPIAPITPIAPIPGGGGNTGGGGPGIGTLPVLPGGGGGGTVSTQPSIIAPAGGLVGASLTATASLGLAEAGTSGVNYQWSITGGRIIGDSRTVAIQFVADTVGTVNLAVNMSAGGSSYSPTASVLIVSPETAGVITTAATVAANANSATASVPAAQSGDRTFRWTATGGAQIVNGQGTASITYRPGGTPGLKQLTCAVNLRGLVTVSVTANVVALGTGAPMVVNIIGGSGDGTYPAGSRVDILANPPPEGKVFDRWTGDIELLGTNALAVALPRATITVPNQAVTLTATYKNAPAWVPTALTNFNPQTQSGANNTSTTVSTTLSYHVPANPSALVFLLHATGSTSSEWFDRPHQLLLARELVAAGFGVAALDSVNRTAGTWAAPAVLASNLDALNHAAALNRLISLGAISASTPIFFIGNAAGANAAARFADLLATANPARPVRGTVLFLSAGIDTLGVTSRVPQFFVLAANDETLGNSGLQDARTINQMMLGRGVATGLVTNSLAPLYPARFRSLALTSPAFSADDAEAVWRAVKDAGLIDANNYPKAVPSTAALTAALPATYRPRARDIAAEFAVAAADREFYSESNARIIGFFNARLAGAAVPTPGRIVNLSTRGRIAYLSDSISFGFTLSGTAQAAVLIRAVGPSLSRFRVPDPLMAPRLEIYRGTTLVASNEGWDADGNQVRNQLSTAATALGAFALNNNSRDAALLLPLTSGSYTALIKGVGGAVGEVLAEVYDVTRNATRLTNLSTLSRINNEDDVLIPGIVVAGNLPRTLVVRAVSQGLRGFGRSAEAVLGDPRLVVYDGNSVVAINNNWSQTNSSLLTAAFPAVGAFPLNNANDAALLDALPAGSYTLQAGATPVNAQAFAAAGASVPNQTGEILVEVYEVP